MFITKLKNILNSNLFIIFLIIITILKVIYGINNVKSKYEISDKYISGIITNIKQNENKVILTIKGKENIIAYLYQDIDFKLGDTVEIEVDLGSIDNSTIFNSFNYKNYMLSKNIHYKINVKNIKLLSKNKNIFYSIKNYLIERIDKYKKSEYLKTFILGDSSYIDDNILKKYRENGISHLFSVSGMHITLLSSIILFILNKIKKTKINYIFVILFLIFYMFLTNFTPSVIRATFLFILLTLNKFLNLKISTFKILIIILCFSLIINPYNIYNIGFKFSYTISLFLISFNKIINRNKNYILKTLITSFISFLASIPILINNYFSINLMTIINNIIFVPIISIIVFPFSLIVLIFKDLGFIYNIIINILESLSIFFTNFKLDIILCKVNIFILILYYLVIILILFKFYKKKYLYIFILVVFIFIHSNINYIIKDSYVTYFDVGQGDSALIHLGYNKGNILIDTGGIYNYNVSTNVINYLKSKGIISINYLILSHGDFDHMGDAINLVSNFKVENVIFNNDSYNKLETELIKVLDSKNIKYYNGLKELNIGSDKIYFLNTKEYGNENDNSNVIYFKLNNYKFLFMGDAGVEREKDILDKYNLSNIDFIKIGHHGSNTSSSEYFIDKIKPKNCLISVGKNNRYGHPKDSVLDILDDYCDIYRTDLNGSIEIKVNRNNYKIKTYSP